MSASLFCARCLDRSLCLVLNRRDKARQMRAMDYREHAPPPALAGLIKTFWTLDGAGAVKEMVEPPAKSPRTLQRMIARTVGSPPAH
jgi:hypothetical protein